MTDTHSTVGGLLHAGLIELPSRKNRSCIGCVVRRHRDLIRVDVVSLTGATFTNGCEDFAERVVSQVLHETDSKTPIVWIDHSDDLKDQITFVYFENRLGREFGSPSWFFFHPSTNLEQALTHADLGIRRFAKLYCELGPEHRFTEPKHDMSHVSF